MPDAWGIGWGKRWHLAGGVNLALDCATVVVALTVLGLLAHGLAAWVFDE